jgi:hypothetical protein
MFVMAGLVPAIHVLLSPESSYFDWKYAPFVPAEAGTQFLRQSLGPRFRGDERTCTGDSISSNRA